MAGKSILKVLFTLTHLSPLIQSVVPAADFYKAKDKAQFLHGGSPQLVRIQRRVSRKRYLESKYVYEYERISLGIPRKFHNKVKPFLKQRLALHRRGGNDALPRAGKQFENRMRKAERGG